MQANKEALMVVLYPIPDQILKPIQKIISIAKDLLYKQTYAASDQMILG